MTSAEALERARELVLAGSEGADVPRVFVDMVEALVALIDAHEGEHDEVRQDVARIRNAMFALEERVSRAEARQRRDR